LRASSYLDKQGGFEVEYQATFQIRLDGSKAIGTGENVQYRFDNGAWVKPGEIPLDCTLTSPTLRCEVVWSRDAKGERVNFSTPTLRKQ